MRGVALKLERLLCGNSNGFGSEIGFIPGRGTGVIVLFNRVIGSPGMSSKIFEIVKEAEDAQKALEPKKKPSPTPPELREYLGIYQGVFETTLKIEFRENSLQVAIVGAQSGTHIVLLPTDEPDVYRAKSDRLAGDRVVFGRSADGDVHSMTAEAGLYFKLSERRDQPG